MIFGKSNEIKKKKEQRKIILRISGIQKFAWIPTKLEDGRWIWFESFYVFFHGLYDKDCDEYSYWYTSREDGIPARSYHATPDFRNIWCTKAISDTDPRHEKVGEVDQYAIRIKASEIMLGMI